MRRTCRGPLADVKQLKPGSRSYDRDARLETAADCNSVWSAHHSVTNASVQGRVATVMPKPHSLDDIDLSLPLAGSEGLDINHASRARIQYLGDQHQALLTQIQFADAKSFALMTLLGLIALRGPIEMHSAAENPVLGNVFLVVSAISVFCCFWAVFPRYPTARSRREMLVYDRWSWPSLAGDSLEPVAYSKFMQTAEISQLVQSLAISNAAVARVLLRKYTALRIAFGFSILVLLIVCIRLSGIA
jgi:Pycsar effector protein